MEFIKYGTINKNITEKLKKTILKDNYDFIQKSNKKDNWNNLNKKQDKTDRKLDISDDDDDNHDESSDTPKRKNKSSIEDKENNTIAKIKKNHVKRPIICICNDLYAKVLLNLRKEALIFNIKKANPQKLLNRLKEVCIKESLSIDTRALKNLSEKSNYDIRVSVNTLEFLSHNKNNAALFKSITEWRKAFNFGAEGPNRRSIRNLGKIFQFEYGKIRV